MFIFCACVANLPFYLRDYHVDQIYLKCYYSEDVNSKFVTVNTWSFKIRKCQISWLKNSVNTVK